MSGEDLIVRCPRCGARNRIPQRKRGAVARCGKCRSPLPAAAYTEALSHPVNVTDAVFGQEVLSYPGTVLVDFWAPWCGACRMVTPALERLARDFSGRIRIAKLNVDENPITSSRFGIRSIPSLLFFKNGALVDTVTGALPVDELERRVRKVL